MNQPKPHTLVGVIDPWGSVRIDIECPYEFGEPRPCKLGNVTPEAENCLWHRYENEDHHPSCPSQQEHPGAKEGEQIECSNPDEPPYCWPEEPEECDGFDFEGEHMHPVPGCWAQHIVHETGWTEAIDFGHHPDLARQSSVTTRQMIRAGQVPDRPLTLPLEVGIDPDEDVVQVTPWPEYQAIMRRRRAQSLKAAEEAGPILHERALTALTDKGVSREEAEKVLAKVEEMGEQLREGTTR